MATLAKPENSDSFLPLPAWSDHDRYEIATLWVLLANAMQGPSGINFDQQRLNSSL